MIRTKDKTVRVWSRNEICLEQLGSGVELNDRTTSTWRKSLSVQSRITQVVQWSLQWAVIFSHHSLGLVLWVRQNVSESPSKDSADTKWQLHSQSQSSGHMHLLSGLFLFACSGTLSFNFVHRTLMPHTLCLKKSPFYILNNSLKMNQFQ